MFCSVEDPISCFLFEINTSRKPLLVRRIDFLRPASGLEMVGVEPECKTLCFVLCQACVLLLLLLPLRHGSSQQNWSSNSLSLPLTCSGRAAGGLGVCVLSPVDAVSDLHGVFMKGLN